MCALADLSVYLCGPFFRWYRASIMCPSSFPSIFSSCSSLYHISSQIISRRSTQHAWNLLLLLMRCSDWPGGDRDKVTRKNGWIRCRGIKIKSWFCHWLPGWPCHFFSLTFPFLKCKIKKLSLVTWKALSSSEPVTLGDFAFQFLLPAAWLPLPHLPVIHILNNASCTCHLGHRL